jgi:Zn-dependent protease with chaperone function
MQRLFLECAVRAALIAAGTAAVLEILRVKHAAARHAAWASVVVLMLVLPVWTRWGPKAQLPVLPSLRTAGAIRTNVPANVLSAVWLEESQIEGRLSEPASPWRSWWTSLAGVYLLGVTTLLVRLAIGTIRAQRLLRAADYGDDWLTSSGCAAPVTVGWLNPRVILPEHWREWPEEQLEAVMAHEREHVRRRDPLVEWLALLNRAIFWFHPLAWWLERRLSGLAEEACDAAVLARGHDPHQYSTYLLEMAQAVMQSGVRVDICGMTMPGSFLTERIRQILEGRPAPRLSRGRMAGVSVACAMVSTLFAAGALEHRKPELSATNQSLRSSEVTKDVRVAEPFAPEPRDERLKPVPVPAALLAQVQTSSPAASQTAASPAQPETHRLSAMYFDLAKMTEADLARAIGAAQKFIGARLQSRDRLAIMTYRGGTFRVLQDFTDDRDRLAQTLQELAAVQSAVSGERLSADGRLTVLRKAIQALGSVTDKKALIFFTVDGAGAPDSQAELQETIDAAVRANVAVYPIDVRGLVDPLR